MYNRYIRNDNGSYTRVPQEDPPQAAPSSHSQKEQPPRQTQPPPSEPEAKSSGGGQHAGSPLSFLSSQPSAGLGGITDGLTSFLRHILDQLHLDHVDTGDLLLLVLLFFLFREDADEELLVSLGLLLIL